MPHVITDACAKDQLCVDACPTDCIHPKGDEPAFEAETQMYINPEECMDCGACISVCPTNAIFAADELPADKAHFAQKAADFYAK